MLNTIKKLSHPLLQALSRRAYFRNAVSEHPEAYILVYDVPVGQQNIKIYGHGSVCRWRAETLLHKEPETIEWLNSFAAGDVFWDVGANIGIYSLYAAVVRKCEVLAFEPAGPNYYILNKNIQLNAIDERVAAYPVAFSDSVKISSFYMHSLEGGHAMFRQGAQDRREREYRQAIFSMGIDEFMERTGAAVPRHLKIDVDGEEFRILKGAVNLLKNPELHSILIELDEADPDYQAAIDLVQGAGFAVAYRAEPEADAVTRNFIFRRPGTVS